MPRLIRNGAVTEDRFTVLRDAVALADVPAGTPAIVPLKLWQAERDALAARADVGVWLAPADDPAALHEDVASLPVIAVDFPTFNDGRGYSIARLLRDRHGFRGELRAIGDVLRDQLYALAECGFDAFAVRTDRDAEAALAGLSDFAGVYAATSRTPQPWFRRHAPGITVDGGTGTLALRIADAAALLRRVATQHAPAVLASSFGAEDMVLLDLIARENLPIRIFTLDTGRLPEETHALIDRVRRCYGLPIDIFAPDARSLQAFVGGHGVNAFYESVELRKACCAVRKTEPLRRALEGKAAWITGLRRAQSVTRSDLRLEEFDPVHALPKFNPLADWSEAEIWSYLRGNDVPYNALHDRGYASIGCAPCTRAIQPGEDVRAGRWWWEAPEHKECGLHPRSPDVKPSAAPASEPVGATS